VFEFPPLGQWVKARGRDAKAVRVRVLDEGLPNGQQLLACVTDVLDERRLCLDDTLE